MEDSINHYSESDHQLNQHLQQANETISRLLQLPHRQLSSYSSSHHICSSSTHSFTPIPSLPCPLSFPSFLLPSLPLEVGR